MTPADEQTPRRFPINLSEAQICAILGALDRDETAYGTGPTGRTAGITRDDVRHQWQAQLDDPPTTNTETPSCASLS
jgi:hypothetical protein